MKKKIEEILEVYYVSPHVPMDGKKYKQPRCGDCFCTVQQVHTHSSRESLVKPLLELFKKNII